MTHLAARIHEMHQGPAKALDIAGDTIATGGADGVVRVMAVNGNHLGSSNAHSDIVNSVALHPAGRAASGSRDRTVRLFDPLVGRSYVVGEHDKWVMTVAWSDDGSRIVSGSEDGTIGIWEPEGASVTRIQLDSPVNSVSWRRDVIAAVTGKGALHLLDSGGAIVGRFDDAEQIPWSVALSPDATRVAWTGRDRVLRIHDLGEGSAIATPAHRAQVWSVAWDEQGERLITASADGTVATWTAAGEALESIDLGVWVRRALFRGVEIYLTSEEGDLHIYSHDGLEAAVPEPVALPDRPRACPHWDPLVEEAGYRPRCEECGSFEEPRLCVTCGHVGCCESQLAHGTKHWLVTGHPNTVPATPGPFRWRWCYEDDMYVKRTN